MVSQVHGVCVARKDFSSFPTPLLLTEIGGLATLSHPLNMSSGAIHWLNRRYEALGEMDVGVKIGYCFK